MLDTRAVMRSLPLVASVLGRKYGVTVTKGGTEAYADGSAIHLPALPVDAPDTFLALARGYIDHEAAHLRDIAPERVAQGCTCAQQDTLPEAGPRNAHRSTVPDKTKKKSPLQLHLANAYQLVENCKISNTITAAWDRYDHYWPHC